VGDVLRLVLRVGHREIEVGGGGHVEDGRFDRAESLLQIAVEAGRGANVVLLPGAELQDEVVGVGAFDEVGADEAMIRCFLASPRRLSHGWIGPSAM
jgi:hypothetical protein